MPIINNYNNKEFVFIIYLLSINIITYFLFAVDKKRSRNHQWRISESTLLIFSFIGGSIGGLIGMLICKHKTKKIKFTIGMPVILVINIFVAKFIMNYLK